MARFELKSAEFRSERESSWLQLESLLDRAESRGVRNLSHADLSRLPALYRGAIGSLSVARAISLDRNMLVYLTHLASRAHVIVYSSKRRPLDAILEFVTTLLPRAVRCYRVPLAAAAACLVAGTVCGYLMVMADIERYYSFVPEAMAGDRTPASSTEQLRNVLYGEASLGSLHQFSTFLFSHNSKIGILCFTLGFAAGIPVIFLLFYNGLSLGAMAALYQTRGLGAEFWAWVLPHGVTEMLAVCLCGMAGLVFGMAIVFPGEHSRLDNLALRGGRAALAVLGAVAMLFIAALVESFFRQLVHDLTVRWLVTAFFAAIWIFYYGWMGRRRA